MIQRVRYWAETLSKFAVPILVAVMTLMWNSAETHSSRQTEAMATLQQKIVDMQLQIATLDTTVKTGINDRFDYVDRRLNVLENHQEKQDDQLRTLEANHVSR
jgi:chaperonin cofactor prefoldin